MTIAKAQRVYGRYFADWVENGGMRASDAHADWLLRELGNVDAIIACLQLGWPLPRARAAR